MVMPAQDQGLSREGYAHIAESEFVTVRDRVTRLQLSFADLVRGTAGVADTLEGWP